ncbi:MAG: hypothetical protein MR425_01530 [Lachnospiraceae bacterium]|nr:hypothetical protein [Lachnospiraceae bacterium]
MILYGALHILTLDALKMSLVLFPFGCLGLFAGMKCSSRVSERVVRRVTAVLLVLSGVSLILKNL